MLRLLLRTLSYHWRGNAAVLLGVLVGSAVLTGALLVGDSLRGSLRDRALRQLGDVDYALVAPRFFRKEVENDLKVDGAVVHAGLMLRGSANAGDKRLNGVTVIDTFTADLFLRNDSLR